MQAEFSAAGCCCSAQGIRAVVVRAKGQVASRRLGNLTRGALPLLWPVAIDTLLLFVSLNFLYAFFYEVLCSTSMLCVHDYSQVM